MTAKGVLYGVFGAILLAMLAGTTWASLAQPLWDWGGLAATNPHRHWTFATLLDAYCGFITFYAWVFYKERSLLGKLVWFVLIMLFGNITMSIYVLRELGRLRRGERIERLLLRRG